MRPASTIILKIRKSELFVLKYNQEIKITIIALATME